MLTTARRLRPDLTVFYITHSESIEDGDKIIGQKMKTIGKALDSQIVLEGLFTIVLYTHVEYNENGLPSYHFVTNRYKNYSAKSPQGMFEDILINNNLAEVCQAVESYYVETSPISPTAAIPASTNALADARTTTVVAPTLETKTAAPEPQIMEDAPTKKPEKTAPKAKKVENSPSESLNPEPIDPFALDNKLAAAPGPQQRIEKTPQITELPTAPLPNFMSDALDQNEDENMQFNDVSNTSDNDSEIQINPNLF